MQEAGPCFVGNTTWCDGWCTKLENLCFMESSSCYSAQSYNLSIRASRLMLTNFLIFQKKLEIWTFYMNMSSPIFTSFQPHTMWWWPSPGTLTSSTSLTGFSSSSYPHLKWTFLIFLMDVLSLSPLNQQITLLIAFYCSYLWCLVPQLSIYILCLPQGNKFLKALIILIITSLAEFQVRHCAKYFTHSNL